MIFTAGDYKTIDFVRIGVFLQVRFQVQFMQHTQPICCFQVANVA
jgi:hypothetical protein